jgi:hypothetical protein
MSISVFNKKTNENVYSHSSFMTPENRKRYELIKKNH